jgi:hypothetical protein
MYLTLSEAREALEKYLSKPPYKEDGFYSVIDRPYDKDYLEGYVISRRGGLVPHRADLPKDQRNFYVFIDLPEGVTLDEARKNRKKYLRTIFAVDKFDEEGDKYYIGEHFW